MRVYTLFGMTTEIERKKLVEAEACVGHNVRAAARAVTQHYEAAFRDAPLRFTQFSILAKLAGLGPSTVRTLADELVVDRTTLTRNLVPLERHGWVRSEAGTDRRERIVHATREGIDALQRTFPIWELAQRRLLAVLGERRWDGLRADLSVLARFDSEASREQAREDRESS